MPAKVKKKKIDIKELLKPKQATKDTKEVVNAAPTNGRHYPDLSDLGLNIQQEKFARFYGEYGNAAKAYREAGYKCGTENSNFAAASTLLRNVKVANAVKRVHDHTHFKHDISAERTLQEMANMAYFDPGDIYDFTGDTIRLKPANQIPVHARKNIASIKTKRYMEGKGDFAEEVEVMELSFWNKPNAVVKIGDRDNLWPSTKKVEHSGKVEGSTTNNTMNIQAFVASLTPEQEAFRKSLNDQWFKIATLEEKREVLRKRQAVKAAPIIEQQKLEATEEAKD